MNQITINTKFSRICFKSIILIMCVLISRIEIIKSSACSNSVPSSVVTITEQYCFNNKNTIIYGVTSGEVSNFLYFMHGVYSLSYTVVRKVDPSGTQSWLASFNFLPTIKSLSLDASEQTVYFARNSNPIEIIRLYSSNGKFLSQHSLAGINGNSFEIKTYPLNDGSGYFVIGTDNTNYATICKYTFLTSNAECQLIPRIYYGYGHLMISNNIIFLLGIFLPNHDLHMYKITFSSTSPDWANQLVCNSGNNCSSYYSESLLSQDKSTIYSFFVFGLSRYLYFVAMSVSDGSVSTNRYKSNNNDISYVYGSALYEDYIIATTNTPNYLVIHNIYSNSFIIKSFATSDGLYGCCVEPSSGRFVVVGSININGYIAKFIPQSIDLNSDFSTASFSMDPISLTTDPINSIPGITIGAIYSVTITNLSYVNKSVTTFQGSTSLSDVYYQITTQSFSVMEGNTLLINPDLPCSFSGSTAITYSLSMYRSSIVPLWISIDSNTGKLAIYALGVKADTVYDFNISSSDKGISNPAQKHIQLTVIKCQVLNCQKCSNSNSSICVICNTDYTLKSESCIIASDTAQVLSITGASLLGISFCVITLTSLINPASTASLWSMINQAQLLFLLLLTRAFIPIDVQNVIIGAKIALNIASYFNFINIGFIHSIIGEFEFDLSNKSLELLDINSDSSIFNLSPIIILVLIIIPINLIVLLIHKLMPTEEPEGRCKRMRILIVKFVNNIFIVFTFGWYIRYILETNQYVLISSINEIFNFDISNKMKISSLIFAILILFLCFCFIFFVSYLSLSSYELVKNYHNKIGEIFCGVNMKKRSKFFVSVLLARRAVFVVLLITLNLIQSWILISILSLLQTCYFIYIIILRPFESTKNNIIEISNEFFFFVLLSSLIFLNSEKDWNSNITEIYMWTIMSNTLVTFIIIIIDSIKSLVIYIKNGCTKPDIEDPRVAPSTIMQTSRIVPFQNPSTVSLSEIQNGVSQEESKNRGKRYISEEINNRSSRIIDRF